MAKGRLTWNKAQVMLTVEKATAASIDTMALRVESEAKQNIVSNNQVDTGFMLNTVYRVSELGNSYPATKPDGTYSWHPPKHDGRSGDAERRKVPQADLPGEFLALVACGAEYAIYQELKQSFLYLALVQVAGDPGAVQGAFEDIL